MSSVFQDERVLQNTVAQQSVHLTGGILRHFRAFSTPEQNPALEVLSRPAHPQVTQTVGRLSQERKSKVKAFAVGYISYNDKMYPEPNSKTTWALFVNESNAKDWARLHKQEGNLKIRSVEVSLKFTRPTKRAADSLKAGGKSAKRKVVKAKVIRPAKSG